MKHANATITHDVGLHARPAAAFVKMAKEFESDITVKNLTRDGEPMNARSVLSLFRAAVGSGHEVEVAAEGQDEEAAVSALIALIEANFGE